MTIGIHGGDTLTYEKYYDGQILDFSSNINPLGYPKALEEGLKDSIEEILVYPDIKYRKLKENISSYLKVPKENILVGNGATELIDGLVRDFRRVILVQPTFAEYELRAELYDLELVFIDLNEDMSLPIDKIKEISQEGDLLILTNPHNPSGLSLDKDQLIAIYMDLLEKNAYLMLDEAFFEFAELDYDSLKIFSQLDFKNIGIIRAATKFFGAPGLRLGYGVFSLDMVYKLEKILMPWSVNSFAVASSDYIFDEDYKKKSKSYIYKERRRLLAELSKIPGISPYPSNSNFILLKVDRPSEDYIFYGLLKKGLLVRRCSNFRNLNGTHIRIAIKKKEENNRLVKALKEVMEEYNGIFI